MKLEIPDLNLFRHRSDIQLRFNDVDVLGHVNNTVFFSFYDTGKALYLTEARGREMNWRKVDLIIANIDCAFMAPIHFGDHIQVLTRCSHIGNKSLVLQQILLDSVTGQIKSMAESVMVSYDPVAEKSVEIQEQTRLSLENYEGHPLG